jgi:4-hydroxy-tetrahydrodipicolinate synthase
MNMLTLESTTLRGSFTPLITPFRDDGAIDFDAYARLIEHQIRGGSHGVVVTGTTGEPSLLSTEERIELLKVALDVARPTLQVVAATGAHNHAETVRLTEAAERLGADALLIVTPYFVRPPQRGLEQYYSDLCARTQRPVLIYHIPGRAAVNLTSDTIARIVERNPNLVGIKHAVADLALVTDLLSRLGPQFRVHVGLEELSFPMLCIGAAGLMNAVANLMPREVASLYEAVAAGDLARARALHFALWELNQAVFFDTNPIPMKYLMMRKGLIARAIHRLPLVPADEEVCRRLDRALERTEAALARLRIATGSLHA